MSFTVKIEDPNGANDITLDAIRVDFRITRDVFEYKRKNDRRANDRGFQARTFVVTGIIKEDDQATADTRMDTLVNAVGGWYAVGNGSTKGKILFTWRGASSPYRCVVKNFDLIARPEYPFLYEWVLTLLIVVT